MTPQSTFMVLAPIDPAREQELRGLLDSMNATPGRVVADNALVPFTRFDTLHFARLLVLDDQTTGDVEVHGVAPRTYPLYLAFLGDIDGDEDTFLHELSQRAEDGLRAVFSCCADFAAGVDLVSWMQQHRSPPIANYVNTRGRTVLQIREEAALRDALEHRIADSVPGSTALARYESLRDFVDHEIEAGRLRLTAPGRTPRSWHVRNLVHAIGVPLLLLALLPLLVVALPFYLLALRRLEKSDPELIPTVDQEYSDNLALAEDHDVTNQFSAIGTVKPGLTRLITSLGVLLTIDYAARHLTRPGRLGRIRTIHFARWVFVGGRERVIFCSNYDGGVDSYMDDFINKAGFGLNASFSNCVGYPATTWLIRDGCQDERKYKEFLRRHTIPTQVWYKAYPDLTAVDLDRNSRLRQGLLARGMDERAAADWLALL